MINLSADKARVFKEIYRVLRPGGKLAIADIALKQPLPECIKGSVHAYVGCVAGALLINEYHKLLSEAGFTQVSINPQEAKILTRASQDPIGQAILAQLPSDQNAHSYIASVLVEARRWSSITMIGRCLGRPIYVYRKYLG